MRIIEKKMIQAIVANNAFKLDNTEVTKRTTDAQTNKFYCDVLLHGHRIATIYFTSQESKQAVTICFSACGWNTVTTRSRINAVIKSLGHPRDGVHTKRGQLYVTDNGKVSPVNDMQVWAYFIQ